MATPIRRAQLQRWDQLPWSRPPGFTECLYPHADIYGLITVNPEVAVS
jgi:hypothetical protein